MADPHTPGAQGPTFAGRPRVPPGETFTREPLTGAKLDPRPHERDLRRMRRNQRRTLSNFAAGAIALVVDRR